MADDVNVKEIDLIKAYSGKLSELKDGSLAATILIYSQVKKIKNDYRNVYNRVHDIGERCNSSCKRLQDQYNSVIEDVGEGARNVIGHSDQEAKNLCGIIAQQVSLLEQNINRLQMLLDNAFQHTKNYDLQITNMVDSCRENLNRQVQILEEYKKLHNL